MRSEKASSKHSCLNPIRELNNFNGTICRLLWSPLSKILSIHALSVNPANSSDKKFYIEFAEQIKTHTKAKVKEQNQSVRPGQAPIFLSRNKALV